MFDANVPEVIELSDADLDVVAGGQTVTGGPNVIAFSPATAVVTQFNLLNIGTWQSNENTSQITQNSSGVFQQND